MYHCDKGSNVPVTIVVQTDPRLIFFFPNRSADYICEAQVPDVRTDLAVGTHQDCVHVQERLWGVLVCMYVCIALVLASELNEVFF